jgi:phosphate transport system ATP-binding protein
MTAFFNAVEYEDGDGGKVGYLAEFDSTEKIFNSPKEKTTQEYISGKFG